jgi:hypothetical protein
MHTPNILPAVFIYRAITTFLAIHRNNPAPGNQIKRQALGKGFKAAMGSGYTANAQDGNLLFVVKWIQNKSFGNFEMIANFNWVAQTKTV